MRAKAINQLIYDGILVFEKNYDAIMNGTFEDDLMSHSRFRTELKAIKEISKEKVYATPTVLQIEAAGFEVLGGLLGKIAPSLVAPERGKITPSEEKIRELIPRQFCQGRTRYEQLLGATDYISGMTDTFAVTLYRRMMGIELPRG